jgi:hypothetical protein
VTTVIGASDAPGRVFVFGECVCADYPLPGLPAAAFGNGHLFWVFETVPQTTPIEFAPQSVAYGTMPYSNGVSVRLAHSASGDAQILVDDTGRFTIDTRGQRITHVAPVDVARDAVSLDLIGVVLPYAMHLRGAWCVHASAVVVDDGVIAFVAESGTGKSTLAAACLQAGASLVSDDVVVALPSDDGEWIVQPTGVPARLRAATARAFSHSDAEADAWGKVRVSGVMETRRLPLRAVYVLQAMTSDAAIERVVRSDRAATVALLAHGKLTALLGAALAGDALARCTAMATRVPVYDLAVPRDLEQISDVVQRVMQWHSRPALARETRAS